MLDNELRLFFCHLPKTAGMTLRAILENHFRESEVFGYDRLRDIPASFAVSDFARYRLIRGHFLRSTIISVLPTEPFVMTMLREPISRVISAYRHIRREPTHQMHKQIGGKDCTLSQFLDRVQPPLHNFNTQTVYLSAPAPEDRTLKGALLHEAKIGRDRGDYASLSRAKEALLEMGFFGIAERFAESAALLGSRLGWEPLTDFQNQNVDDSGEPSVDDRTALDRIAEQNRLDIELHQFGTALFAEQYRQFMRSLLRREFAARARQMTRSETFRLSFEDPILGSGWHERETTPDGKVYRWTGPGASASVYFALVPTERMELKFGLHHVITTETLDRLSIRINGIEVQSGRQYDESQGLIVVNARFPGRLLSTEDGISVLEICVPEALRPVDVLTGNPDKRRLGVAVRWITVEPTAVNADEA